MFMCDITKTSPYASNFLFTVNYCLFANGEVSIRFNGKDNVLSIFYRINSFEFKDSVLNLVENSFIFEEGWGYIHIA